jgi:hypothetical protein
MAQETKLNINRVTSFADRIRAYIIVLDGVEVGQITAGESFDMAISPGEHRILLKIDWCRSNKLDFTAQAGTEVTLNCGSSLTGWRIFMVFLYVSFLRDRYLWIQEGTKIITKKPNDLPTISKSMQLVVLMVFVIFALSFVIVPVIKTKLGLPPASVSSKSLTIMKVIGIALSVYGLSLPWFFQWYLSKETLAIGQSRQGTFILLLGYIFLISPVVYGLILFTYGMHLAEFYYFIGDQLS